MKIQPQDTPIERTPLVLVTVGVAKLADVMNQMNPTEKQKTGLSKLTAQELENLHDFLDNNIVLAPGDPPKGPH